MNALTPNQNPPAGHVGTTSTPPTPVHFTAAEVNLLPKVGTSATPAYHMPGVAAQAGLATATTWKNGQHITNQWTINQDRNSWIGVSGVGWQKLSTASDSGVIALTMLASFALVSKASVNYRTEADGMVHEIYMW